MGAFEEHLYHVFAACDEQKTGYIDRSTFRRLCDPVRMTDDEFDFIFCDLDADKDGRISIQEFVCGFRSVPLCLTDDSGMDANDGDEMPTDMSDDQTTPRMATRYRRLSDEAHSRTNIVPDSRTLDIAVTGISTAGARSSNARDARQFARSERPCSTNSTAPSHAHSSSPRDTAEADGERAERRTPCCHADVDVSCGTSPRTKRGTIIRRSQRTKRDKLRDGIPTRSGSFRRYYIADAQKAWDAFVADALHNEWGESMPIPRQEDVCELYQQLHSRGSPKLLSLFEDIIVNVISDLHIAKGEKERLEQQYNKEKDQHSAHLRTLEDEIECQVQKTEHRIKTEEKKRAETELFLLEEELKQEIKELQLKLKRYQQTEAKMNADKDKAKLQTLELKNRASVLTDENKTLRTKIAESQTNLTTLHSELAQQQIQHDDCQEQLLVERQQLQEVVGEQQSLLNQIQMLHESNRRLQDVNDDLRSTMELHKKDTQNKMRRSIRRRTTLPLHASLPLPRLVEDVASPSPQRRLKRSSDNPDARSLNSDIAEELEEDETEKANSTDSEGESMGSVGPCSLSEELSHAVSSSCRVTEWNETHHNASSVEELADSGISTLRGSESSGSPGSQDLSYNPLTNAHIQPQLKFEPERMYKLVLAGDAAVGKSSFIQRFCQDRFNPNIHSTLGVDFQMRSLEVDGRKVALQLWDTAGQERFRSIAKSYFRRADGVLMLYDVTYERSFLNVREWVDTVTSSASQEIPIMLCGNKTDLRDALIQKGSNVVMEADGKQLAREHGTFFIETSAKDGSNVEEAVLELARQLCANEDIDVKSSGITLREGAGKKKGKCSC
ncbi:PREDICTED: ras and EF-hand domain-containing protein-like [Priapulus caudatus]|uniref:Ras and EF-hand domain-containing protein-like n=1 Tax=Priapulus caudatus TaxID=37621 RepID=A0ABM1EM83_PRICU|nr:PREDICTED: ras and EF-hand domain-containing protein-like [Priapulus caudatus]